MLRRNIKSFGSKKTESTLFVVFKTLKLRNMFKTYLGENCNNNQELSQLKLKGFCAY